MANYWFVSITGAEQKKFKGEARKPHEGKIACLRVEGGAVAPMEHLQGRPMPGKRRYQPVVFVKAWDATSPMLSAAMAKREMLTEVLFERVHTGPEGDHVVDFTIKLTRAFITELVRTKPWQVKDAGVNELSGAPVDAIRAGMASGIAAATTTEWEKVSLIFETIDEEHKRAKTISSDIWA